MKKNMRYLVPILIFLFIGFFCLGCSNHPADLPYENIPETAQLTQTPKPIYIILWTKEGDLGYQYVNSLTKAYQEMHPEVIFTLKKVSSESLLTELNNSNNSVVAPDLLWVDSYYLNNLISDSLIQPVNNQFDFNKYLTNATDGVRSPDGKIWGVPIYNGGHLMLFYNKSLISSSPKNTDELIDMGEEFMNKNVGKYALVYNQEELISFFPWMGGFGGKLFAADGVTPNLDSPEMISAMQFYYDLKFKYKLIPEESDYDTADSLFMEGKAAMIINGDWSISDYQKIFGDNLGVSPIPLVSPSGYYPKPFTSAVYFMISNGLEKNKLTEVDNFINFATNKENQLALLSELNKLPASIEALSDKKISNDPILFGSVMQMEYGTPFPTVTQLPCVWDSLKRELQAYFDDAETVYDAANNSQKSAIICIASLD